ncbi:MAG: hypothetical protein V4736_16330 [Bdellovibrionota bacterium]
MFLLTLLMSLSASAESCDKVTNYRQFFKCSLEKHPEHEIAKLKTADSQAIVDRSSQWENPDLDLKTVGGEKAGEPVGSVELSVAIPISQIWVNGARRQVGRADKRIAELESQEMSIGAQKKLIVDLYRLRQVDESLELVNEAIGAFGKIRGQLRGRLARGPEQEITLNLVELASGDYELRRNHLMVERTNILSTFKALWGPNFEIKKEFLPPLKETWPKLSSTESTTSKSLATQRLLAQSEKLIAESSLAMKESWPTVKIGPTVERTTEGLSQYYSYGFNLNMTLPLFSMNGGARRYAESQAMQARLLSDFASKRSQLDRTILALKYQSAVDSLRRSTTREELKKKHNRIDSLFRQGLASGGIVIEAHRQITEFAESQHEHETAAIDSYIELKAMNGESIEEIF